MQALQATEVVQIQEKIVDSTLKQQQQLWEHLVGKMDLKLSNNGPIEEADKKFNWTWNWNVKTWMAEGKQAGS